MLGLFVFSVVCRRRVPRGRAPGVGSHLPARATCTSATSSSPSRPRASPTSPTSAPSSSRRCCSRRSSGISTTSRPSGFLSLPRPIVFSTVAPFAGYLAVRIGERTLAVVGTSAVVVSMGVFALAGALHGPGPGGGGPRSCRGWASGWRRRRSRRRCPTSSPRGPRHGGRLPAAHEPGRHRGRDPGHGDRAAPRPSGHHGPDALLHAFHLAYLVGGAVAAPRCRRRRPCPARPRADRGARRWKRSRRST